MHRNAYVRTVIRNEETQYRIKQNMYPRPTHTLSEEVTGMGGRRVGIYSLQRFASYSVACKQIQAAAMDSPVFLYD